MGVVASWPVCVKKCLVCPSLPPASSGWLCWALLWEGQWTVPVLVVILAVWIILPPQYPFHANWPYSVRLFWCRMKQWHRDILFVPYNNFCLAFGHFWAFLGFFHNTVSYGHRMIFLNDHQGIEFSILISGHFPAMDVAYCFAASWCPSVPLCPLSSSFLPWITTSFQQSLLVNINIFSILLVNMLNSDEMFASSHLRSTFLPWVQSQHCSCSFLAPPL